MTWKPANYTQTGPSTYDIKCPYCGEDAGTYDRRRDPSYPPPETCSECERTFIIPVSVSRSKSA